MSSGLRESRNFARRQRRRRSYRRVFALSVFIGLGLFAYQSGKVLAERELRQAQEEVTRLMGQVAELERKNMELRRAAADSDRQTAELRRRYDTDVPKGDRKTLLGLIDEQIGKGAKIDRLSFLIGAASHQDKCDGKPVTKRFIVRTPLYDGAASAVRFADDALTVTADGEAALDEQGRVQAWFDPAKPVTLNLARLGNQPQRLPGKLPLHHKILLNGSEYRLTVVAGDRRGFVNVTADRCQFP